MKFFVYAIATTVAIVTGQTLMSQSPIDLPAFAKLVANTGNFSIAFSTASAVVNKDNNLAVVGIFFDLDPHDKPNPFLAQFFSHFHHLTKPGDNFTLTALDPSSLHVSNSNVFRYSGSLTTEPFTEGVEWNVLQKVHTLSKPQLKQWSNVIHLPNGREIQDLNGRVVTLTRAHSVC
ncbi:hypothetical protein DYB25_012754 [Aphanomyces astaci]|uniref:Alpha-carbonic anhydrase domain-containing protein n=1 Tax=Aphanomyces astaci TaxID=112090 RepID=A0A397CVJ9_APHAT|nr:hypothetical protein DYB25_012754 [Aphanomyces astaci]RHY44854.1 hypothetical protein DYB34_013024 [Aphanomyces astaci]RHY49688.1 hypothetical protein DYB30_008899 [Aphanomyces astaci]RHY67791.1 hypothetical protein DYB38_011171 [Aphanomyces astaci]RHZ09106.1 hypothetical protein DYB31_014145 [Aphanomyces astaci]